MSMDFEPKQHCDISSIVRNWINSLAAPQSLFEIDVRDDMTGVIRMKNY